MKRIDFKEGYLRRVQDREFIRTMNEYAKQEKELMQKLKAHNDESMKIVRYLEGDDFTFPEKRFIFHMEYRVPFMHLDTLTMKMLDYIKSKDSITDVDIYISDSVEIQLVGICPDSDEWGCSLCSKDGDTLFDAVLEASLYVWGKEKQ